jgi:predicted lipase
MLQSNSPLLEHFAGLYSYGHPKIADAEFAKVFSPRMTSKIFHHVYNNDIVPRIPTYFNYK